MRMSCNGCRVLRKGCSEECSIRPCLDWIKSPDSQANATIFLAKFYGRAGLINLINAGPPHLRPAVFRSLLYEACGRIVNPIYGSAGLFGSGNWQLCQNAVEAVLRGAPISQIATDPTEDKNGPPFKAYDIRHVNKDDFVSGSCDLHRVRTRCRFKRSGQKDKKSRVSVGSTDESGHRSPSHESSLSHQSEATEPIVKKRNRDSETEEADPTLQSARDVLRADGGEIDLDLTLGYEPLKRSPKPKKPASCSARGDAGFREMELTLDYSAS